MPNFIKFAQHLIFGTKSG